ncbi:MAG: glutaredoxin family protein [Pseudonocardiales bacterium]
MPPVPRVTVLATRGCHLCEQACADVARIAAELGVAWEERDITADAELMAEHAEEVPVILVDGRRHDCWRVDEGRLRAALASPSRRRGAGPPG